MGINTWVIRLAIQESQEDIKFEAINLYEESMLFKNEACHAVCEYAPNKLVIYGSPTHLFIVHNWQLVMKVEDDDIKNKDKYFISMIPGFNE